MPPAADNRPAIVVMRQYRELMIIRAQLIKQGLVPVDCTAADIVSAMRKAVPPDLFGELPAVQREK